MQPVSGSQEIPEVTQLKRVYNMLVHKYSCYLDCISDTAIVTYTRSGNAVLTIII